MSLSLCLNQGYKENYSIYGAYLSLYGQRWANKAGIFILGTLTLMTVGLNLRFRVDFQHNNYGLERI